MLWRNFVTALIGIWFIISPFVLGYTGYAGRLETSIIGGLILLILGGCSVLNERARRQVWIRYVEGLVGIWFIVAPWVMSFVRQPGEFWTSLILGIVALVLSVWDIATLPEETAARQHAH